MGPSMEEQLAAAKPMLKDIDHTTMKFIDAHCHIDTMYKKEGFTGDWDSYRLAILYFRRFWFISGWGVTIKAN